MSIGRDYPYDPRDAFVQQQAYNQQIEYMKQMAAQQNQAMGLGLGLGGVIQGQQTRSQQADQSAKVPNPEPNKVLLLLGDDE